MRALLLLAALLAIAPSAPAQRNKPPRKPPKKAPPKVQKPKQPKAVLTVNAKEGETLTGERTFRVTVQSSAPVTQVEFYVGEDLRDSDTSTPESGCFCTAIAGLNAGASSSPEALASASMPLAMALPPAAAPVPTARSDSCSCRPPATPPAQMLKRRPDLPRHMAGGPENPLGARAMYLGSTLYRIHGTNEPHTIGQNVSSGCIRMMNEDVTDLYERVRVGTRVKVI